jgi:hypothetical protein
MMEQNVLNALSAMAILAAPAGFHAYAESNFQNVKKHISFEKIQAVRPSYNPSAPRYIKRKDAA